MHLKFKCITIDLKEFSSVNIFSLYIIKYCYIELIIGNSRLNGNNYCEGSVNNKVLYITDFKLY